MPELPEVETTIRDLKKNRAHKILCARFIDVWTDAKDIVKRPKNFEDFKENLIGRKIEKIWRRGKNIIFDLSEGFSLLVHQKLTGHLLVGKWQMTGGIWQAKEKGPLGDPKNRFLHLIFWLDNGKMLALSDLRKFAKIELLNCEEIKKELSSLGPEPLEDDFTFEKFKECLQRKRGKIKQVLMNQTVIVGIGNIYSDEILWTAGIHPFKEVKQLNDREIKKIYDAMRKILPIAIKLGGESFSDYRRPSGEKGYFDKERKVYRREGEPCSRCGTSIKRVKLAGRSVHYCTKCQKLT